MRRRGLASVFDRVALFARGADEDVGQAEAALARGEALGALRHAERALSKASENELALALAAEAARALGLWERLAALLERLIAIAPDLTEAALELGLTLRRLGRSKDAELVLSRLAAGADATSDAAAIALAEDDLGRADLERAGSWLRGRSGERARVLRAVTAALAGAEDVARDELEGLVDADPTDALAALARGLAGREHDSRLLVRAALLDAPFARRRLAERLGQVGETARKDLITILDKTRLLEDPVLEAAAATASGERARATAALTRAADAGDHDAARELVRMAMLTEDPSLLTAALARLPGDPLPEERAVAASLVERDAATALTLLEAAGPRPWAAKLRGALVASLLPVNGLQDRAALGRLVRRAARAVDDPDALAAEERLAEGARRLPRLSVMGEFNAGKSTLVNALLGAEIAPMGVLPTTAVLHHIVYAEEPFARITLDEGRDRVVAPTELRSTLRELDRAGRAAARVTVGLPLPFLRSIELVDTPGYNAESALHREIADRGLEETDVVLFLLDAGQAWKASERGAIERAQAAGASLLVVVNKIDRVPDGERAKLHEHVERETSRVVGETLAEVSWVSAREGLAARLRGEEAEGSGVAGLLRLLDERIVARAAQLLDRAERRRLARIVTGLLLTTRRAVEVERAAAKAEAEARAKCDALAQALSSEGSRVAHLATREIAEPLAALHVDLSSFRGPLDGSARRAVAARVVGRLSSPLLGALAEEVPTAARPAVDAAIEAALLGAAHVAESPAALAALTRDRLVELAAAAVSRALFREARIWSLGPPAAHRALVTVEALVAALPRAHPAP